MLQIVRSSVAAAVVALTLAAMACGDENATPNAVPSATPAPGRPTASATATALLADDEFRAAAERAAERARIELADFPTGWTSEPQVITTLRGPGSEDIPVYGDALEVTVNVGDDFALTDECLAWSVRLENFPGAVIERSSDEFARSGEEMVSSDVGVYADASLAKAATDAHDALFATCGGQFEELMRVIPDAEYGEGSTTATLEVLPPIRGTDWSHSFRMTIEIPSAGLTTVLEYHALRHGRVIAALEWTNTNASFDSDLGERLVAILSERVREADTTLTH